MLLNNLCLNTSPGVRFVLKTVKDACELHPMALNYAMGDQIENLLDFIDREGDGSVFFQKNYITQGMENLFQIGLKRLAGLSDQAVWYKLWEVVKPT